jgi:predicted MFS family arabinose efflux permease
MAILAAFQSVAPTVGLLLIGRFTFVLLAVIRVQVQVIFIQQWFRPTLYATVNSLDFGLRSAAQALTMGATPVLVMLLGSWRHFYMAVAVALVGLSLVWSFLGRQNQPARDTGSAATSARKTNPARILRRSKAVWIMAASQIGAAAAFASFISLFPTYAMERLGLSLTTVGLMMALFPVGAVLGSLSAGPLSQAIGRRKPFVWGPGLFLPVMYSALLWADSAPLSMLLLLAAGFFAMAPPPILATIPFDLKLAPREVAVALGLTRTLFPLGAALGPLLVGTLQELTGSLFLGLIIVAPMAATLFVGGLLLPETGPKGRLTGA